MGAKANELGRIFFKEGNYFIIFLSLQIINFMKIQEKKQDKTGHEFNQNYRKKKDNGLGAKANELVRKKKLREKVF